MPKKSDTPREKVKKASGDLYDIENPLVATIDTFDKKGNKKSGGGSQHLSYFRKNKTDTVDKTEKSQISKKTVPTSKKINPTHLTQ